MMQLPIELIVMSFSLLLHPDLTLSNPPSIDLSHSMRVLILPRSTKVGTLIYRLKGSDADNDILRFGVRGPIGKELIEIKSAGFFEADVFLKSPLKEDEYQLTIFAADDTGGVTEVESTILVKEGQIESPFIDFQPIWKVYENALSFETVGTVMVNKRNSSNLYVTFELKGSDSFAIKYSIGPNGTSVADISLVQSLDYEKKNIYILTLLAFNAYTNESIDTRNVVSVEILIAVLDVQDTPPVFSNMPTVVRIPENAKMSSNLFRVHAEDGDYGNQRNVTYSIDKDSPLKRYFSINDLTGDLVLARQVTDIKLEMGISEPLLLTVKATELGAQSDESEDAITSTSTIALVIVSTDNKPPVFTSEHMIGSIEENSQTMTPVKWEVSVPQVTDKDPGLNGTIQLSLEDPSDTFMILPMKGVNEITFSLVVKEPNNLDFETREVKNFEMRITATDESPITPLSSTVLCTIKLKDINDNFPQFSKRTYEAEISEDAQPGVTIIQIEAHDLDAGEFGKIKFTSINGPISQDLHLDPETGVITLISNANLDREKVGEYRLSIEARDEFGNGNKNITDLYLRVKDANDNAPLFLQPRYDAVLNPDRRSFTQPLIVKAIDADEHDTPNSNVTYEIIGGNYQDKFEINQVSGEIKLKSPLTIERSAKPVSDFPDENKERFIPFITLTVRAHNPGIPYQTSLVQVHVHNPDYLNRTVTLYIDQPEEAINSRKLEIESAIGALAGAKAHIYSTRPFKDSTIINAWIAYPTRSSIDLRKLPMIVSDIMGTEISGNHENELETASVVQNDYNLLIWLLFILILMTFMFIILFILCWCYWNRYKKRMPETEQTKEFVSTIQVSSDKNSANFEENTAAKSRNKRVANGTQAWNEDVEKGGKREGIPRPSSAPHDEMNELNHPAQHSRYYDGSQSLNYNHIQHPSIYQRIRKMNRQQRARVAPDYYQQMENDLDIDDLLEEERDYYLSQMREESNVKTRPRRRDRRSYQTSYTADDIRYQSMQKRKPKYFTRQDSTEILVIKTPPIDDDEYEETRSASQLDFRHDDDNRYLASPDHLRSQINTIPKRHLELEDDSRQRRQINFKTHITYPIAEIAEVPGIMESENEEQPQPEVNTKDETKAQETGKNSVKRKGSDNSEKSSGSDSGIGPAANTNLEMKHSNIMEKKSIFTIAYNDVKTGQLKSPESPRDQL